MRGPEAHQKLTNEKPDFYACITYLLLFRALLPLKGCASISLGCLWPLVIPDAILYGFCVSLYHVLVIPGDLLLGRGRMLTYSPPLGRWLGLLR